MSTELTFAGALSTLSLGDQSNAKEVVYQGKTIFAPPPAPFYQYAIVVQRNKIHFWLEDCDSKKQWRSRALRFEEYVNSTNNSIPSAQPADYAKCFHSLMNIDTRGEMTDIPVGFRERPNGLFRLELAVKMLVINETHMAFYAFDLESIPVDRIDVLEAKVRDLQQEVKNLEQQLKVGDANDRMLILQAQGTGKFGDTLLWADGNCSMSSVIPIDIPGVYHAVVVVNCTLDGSRIRLMNGAECLQEVYCSFTDAGSTTLTSIARLEKNAQLSVVCTANLVSTNRLTLVRLGK